VNSHFKKTQLNPEQSRMNPWTRPAVRFAAIALVLAFAAVGRVMWHTSKQSHSDKSQLTADQSISPLSSPEGRPSKSGLPRYELPVPISPPGSAAANARLTASMPTPGQEPTLETRRLVSSLSLVDQAGRSVTAEQAVEWKQNLEDLVQHGPAAVPAIIEFLKQNKDMDFGTWGGQELGYSSARRAMFNALVQIGGPEAIAATSEVLQSTADPREIALLAQNLETLAPGEHRQEAVQAAREALEMAAKGKLEEADVAPLFEVLHSYGDISVVAELEQATKHWNYYGAIALTQLPDGAGIPALIQMAQGSTSARGNALEMLAQASPQFPEARAALLEMTRNNKISPNQWPYLTPLLAGGEYHYQDSVLDTAVTTLKEPPGNAGHVLFGNQHFYTVPGADSFTPEQINQRVALIDDLRSATSEPAAIQALDRARDLLNKRAPKTVAVSP
jgi:hypothetical protein